MVIITKSECESVGARGMRAWEWHRTFQGPYEFAPEDGWYEQKTDCTFNNFDKLECIGRSWTCQPSQDEIDKNNPDSISYTPPDPSTIPRDVSGMTSEEQSAYFGNLDNFDDPDDYSPQTCFFRKKGDIINRNKPDVYSCVSMGAKQTEDIDGDAAIDRISTKLASMIAGTSGVDPTYLLSLPAGVVAGGESDFKRISRRGSAYSFTGNAELREQVEDEFKILFEARPAGDPRTSITDGVAEEMLTYQEEEDRPIVAIDSPSIRALALAIASATNLLTPDYAMQCMVKGGNIRMEPILPDAIKPLREPVYEWEKYPVGSDEYNNAITAARDEMVDCSMTSYTKRWWSCMYAKEARERAAAKLKSEEERLARERDAIKTQRWRYTRGVNVSTAAGADWEAPSFSYKITDPIDTDRLSAPSQYHERMYGGTMTAHNKRSQFVEQCLMRCAGDDPSGGKVCNGVYFTGDGDDEQCFGVKSGKAITTAYESSRKYYEKTDLPDPYSHLSPWTYIGGASSQCKPDFLNTNYDCSPYDTTPTVPHSGKDTSQFGGGGQSFRTLSGNNKCGPDNNNTRCPDNKCCSQTGNCGGTIPTRDNTFCTATDNTGSLGNRMGVHGSYAGIYDGIGDEPPALEVEKCLEAGRCEKVWGTNTDPEYAYCKDLTYPQHPSYTGTVGDKVCPQPVENNIRNLIDTGFVREIRNTGVILNENSGWNRREYDFSIDTWNFFGSPGTPWYSMCKNKMKATDVGYSVYRKNWNQNAEGTGGGLYDWKCIVYEDNDNTHGWNQKCVDSPFENSNQCLSYPEDQPWDVANTDFVGSEFHWRRKVPGEEGAKSVVWNPQTGWQEEWQDPGPAPEPSIFWKVSTNNKCGPDNNHTICPGKQCCSTSGWCSGAQGTYSAHCAAEDATGWRGYVGQDDGAFDGNPNATEPPPFPGIHWEVSTNNKCGPEHNNTICPGKQCCSTSGWCSGAQGTYSAHCKTESVLHSWRGYVGQDDGAFDGTTNRPDPPPSPPPTYEGDGTPAPSPVTYHYTHDYPTSDAWAGRGKCFVWSSVTGSARNADDFPVCEWKTGLTANKSTCDRLKCPSDNIKDTGVGGCIGSTGGCTGGPYNFASKTNMDLIEEMRPDCLKNQRWVSYPYDPRCCSKLGICHD